MYSSNSQHLVATVERRREERNGEEKGGESSGLEWMVPLLASTCNRPPLQKKERIER